MARHRKVAVKLTKDQWLAVKEAVAEWGALCRYEAEMKDGRILQDMDERGKVLEELATEIGLQSEDV